MKNKFRIPAIILSSLLCLSAFSGCQTKKPAESDISAAVSKADKNAEKYATLTNPNIKMLYFVSEAQYKANKEADPSAYDAVWEAKPEYEKKYGGTVDFVICPWGDMTSRLLTMLNTGDVPDVVLIHNQNFPMWPLKNAVQSLDGILDFDTDYFDAAVTNAFKYKGNHYAAGVAGAPIMVYYNKTLFEDNGVKDPGAYYKEGKWDWQAFKACGTEMTYGDVYGFGWWEFYNQLMVTNGVQLLNFNDDGSIKTGVNTPNAIEALQFYQDSMLKDKFVNTKLEGNAFVQAFQSGKLAMTCEYGLGKYMSNYELGVVPFPKGPKGEDGVATGGSSGWGIPIGSKNTDGAAAFITTLCSKQSTDEKTVLRSKYDEETVNMYLDLQKHLSFSPEAGVTNFFDIQFRNVADLKSGVPVATVAKNFEGELNSAIKSTMEGK